MISRRGLRPFLKWVGGKRQLLPALRRFYPTGATRYHEPFVGSGAVFFDLVNHGLIDHRAAALSDDNADLIGCYRRVADSVADVLQALDSLAAAHQTDARAHYLRVRDQQFNPLRAAWRIRGAVLDDYSPQLAAMLIYLNRTGYNGLFRLNASGEFNVPPGRYQSPRVVDPPLLIRVSEVLRAPGIRLERAAFDRVLDEARAGDFAYFDPPYAPLSKTASFRGYTGRGFNDVDQERLQQVVIALARRGTRVLLSNSIAPAVTRLYEGNAAAADAGLHTHRVRARRSVNSHPGRRGEVDELLVSNVLPREPDDSISRRLEKVEP